MSLIRIDRTKRIEADHALALRDMEEPRKHKRHCADCVASISEGRPLRPMKHSARFSVLG